MTTKKTTNAPAKTGKGKEKILEEVQASMQRSTEHPVVVNLHRNIKQRLHGNLPEWVLPFLDPKAHEGPKVPQTPEPVNPD